MRYVVSIPLPEWIRFSTVTDAVRWLGEQEAEKLGVTLPDSDPKIISGIGTMKYAQWRWEG